MAKLIVPGGLNRLAAAPGPPPASRVIALELRLAAGVGITDWCFTPTLGNRTWLRSVDVWAYSCAHGIAMGGFFYLMFGGGVPVAPGDIAVRWSPIIPLHCGVKPGFGWFECTNFHRRFTMCKLFKFDELRFGVTIENGFNQDFACTVAFEISEG